MEKCCKNCRHLTENPDHVFVCLVLGKFLSLEFAPQIPDEAFSCNLFAIENKMQAEHESRLRGKAKEVELKIERLQIFLSEIETKYCNSLDPAQDTEGQRGSEPGPGLKRGQGQGQD